MNRQESARACKAVFDGFDLDGNGTIDINELQAGLSKQKGIDYVASSLQGILEKFDANQNGVLERDEFVDLMHSPELDEFFAEEDAKARAKAEETAVPAMGLDAVYHLESAPEETPALLEEKLAEFDQVLDKIDNEKKRACAMAQERAPDLARDDFKLAFLRCEVFNAELAVERWIRYWDLRLGSFGEDKAFLPLTLEGAMKGREKAIASSYFRYAEGVTDPDGRAIALADFREEGNKDLSDDDLFMAIYYHVHVSLSRESAQKRGDVIFYKLMGRFFDLRPSVWNKIACFHVTLPMRSCAMHIVKPPLTINVLYKIAKLLHGPTIRNRIYVHSGSTDKVLTKLSKFGLGTKDKLPDVFGGDLSFSPPAKLTFPC